MKIQCWYKTISISSRLLSLAVMQQLPELSLMAGLLLLVPVQIRDSIYELVANNRYQWFGKTEECFIPDQSIRNKL